MAIAFTLGALGEVLMTTVLLLTKQIPAVSVTQQIDYALLAAVFGVLLSIRARDVLPIAAGAAVQALASGLILAITTYQFGLEQQMLSGAVSLFILFGYFAIMSLFVPETLK